jgi:hypothetical protein
MAKYKSRNFNQYFVMYLLLTNFVSPFRPERKPKKQKTDKREEIYGTEQSGRGA